MISVFIKTKTLLAPVSGRIVALNTVPYFREAIRRGISGIAVIPSDTKIYAPMDGMVYTRQSRSANAEIYIDSQRGSIALGGAFKSYIKNSRVHAGDLIAAIDIEFIRNSGYFTYVLMLMPKTVSARLVDSEWVQGGESCVVRL